jgi:RimJ/RimL family protein N-acetyltransferase
MTTVRLLTEADAAAFQSLRLQGLLECPAAFASSHAEEAGEAIAAVAERLQPDGVFGVYGAFDEAGGLVGVAGLGRERMRRLAHKAVLWGMYVAPSARRLGVARRIVSHLLQQAAGEPGLRQVNLGVLASNGPALALYSAFGFVAWGHEPAAAWDEQGPHDETWMVCVLPGRQRSARA